MTLSLFQQQNSKGIIRRIKKKKKKRKHEPDIRHWLAAGYNLIIGGPTFASTFYFSSSFSRLLRVYIVISMIYWFYWALVLFYIASIGKKIYENDDNNKRLTYVVFTFYIWKVHRGRPSKLHIPSSLVKSLFYPIISKFSLAFRGHFPLALLT